ncbi:polysaccharide export protein [Shewanella marina]|uniref:polysaccharide export protein n=1 Tax=Shewanella marina TaxID=487319 RepID=UPI00272A05FF|nr:polysaccharide export protein [Shewanella marina]
MLQQAKRFGVLSLSQVSFKPIFTSRKKLLVTMLALASIGGCTVMPGNHLSTSNKVVVANQQQQPSLDDLVKVYPVTPTLVNQLKQNSKQPVTQANPQLEQALTQYEYHIGSGDVLNITIWDHPELTIPAGSYRSSAEAGNWVHADGTIFYPYIGRVHVAGQTVTQVRDTIAKKLAKYIESPQVDVNVAAFRSQKTYITGEVKTPGAQPISNIPLTLLDAVNKAGGISKDADWRSVSLTRDGKEQQISLYGLIQKGDLTQNRLLQNGDIVHVPLNDNQKVFVMGEVKDAKTLKIDRVGMSLTEALSEVGGIDQLNADATGIFVIRKAKVEASIKDNKQPQMLADIYQLDMQDATALVLGTEFELRPYDVVYVTAAPISRWNRVITQLLPTITGFNQLSEGSQRIRHW